MLFKCPECFSSLNDNYQCINGHSYMKNEGVLELLTSDFRKILDPWLEKYHSFQVLELPETIFENLPASGVRFNKNIWSARIADLKIIKSEIQSNYKNALDIGGWNGWLANGLTKENLKVCSADYFIHKKNGLRAKQFYKNPHWTAIQMDLEHLNIFHTRFDIIVVNRCISYFTNFEETIKQCQSILEENGKIVITGINLGAESVSNEFKVRDDEFKSKSGFSLLFKSSKAYFDKADYLKLKALNFTIKPYPTLKNQVKNLLKIGNRSYYAIYQKRE